MNILIRKISRPGLLKVQLIVGVLVMFAAAAMLPVSVAQVDIALLLNPFVIGVVGFGMLAFVLVAYFCLIRPYIVYRRFPNVQAETDGKNLYIHANKEACIPLSALTRATVRVEMPYLLQKEFLREFIIHTFSEEYGTVVLEIPGYGTYKMRYVSHARNSANELLRFLNVVMNNI